MNKKQLYLHIGSRKTGTTALQNFFSDNRKLLKQKGISYPEEQGKTAQHRPAQSVLAKEDNPPWFPDDLESCQIEWQKVLKQIKTDIGLISSEFFFRCHPRHILKIKELTADYQVKIVPYIRRQNEMVQSEYNQVVKAGGSKYNICPFDDYVRELKKRLRFDYLKTINNWADVFGQENIIVRPYEKQQFHGSSIFSDFLHNAFGLELTDEYTLPQKDPNSRLHRVTLEYKRMINCLDLAHKKRNLIIEPLREISAKLYDQARPDFSVQSPKKQCELIEECQKDNKAIAQKYLDRENEDLYYAPLPDIKEPWQPYDLLLEEDARFINEYLFENCPKFHDMIAVAVNCAKRSDEEHRTKAAELLLPGLKNTESSELLSPEKCTSKMKLYHTYMKLSDKHKRTISALAKNVLGKKYFNKIKSKFLS